MDGTNDMNKINDRPAPAENTYSGTLDSVSSIVEFVSSYARKEDFVEKKIEEIRIAVEEAVKNIVEHAYCNTTGDIIVRCTMNNVGQLLIIVSDYGKSFNMLIASDPLFDADFQGTKRPSTRLMKRFMSSVEYQRSDNKNVLTLAASRIPVS